MLFEKDHSPVITEIVYIEEPAGSSWSFPLHRHQDRLELSCIISGTLECWSDGISKRLSEGDLLIKNAGVIHAEKAEGDTPLQEICISFDQVHVKDMKINHLIADDAVPFLSVKDEPLIRELFIYLEQNRNDKDKDLQNRLAGALISLVLKYYEKSPSVLSKEKLPSAETVMQVKAYLDQHYSAKISLDQLASMFFISPFYLSRQFHKHTGYSIRQYILQLQMGEAENLLIFSDLSIKEIALKCGYDNLPYFYSLFRKYAHCTPAEYRRQYAKTDQKKSS